MSDIRAVVVDPAAPGHFAIASVKEPAPAHNEALVRVVTISINGGEVFYVWEQSAGARPGWDMAGVVEQEAADGSGPKKGKRVVGWMPRGAWAELVAVPTVNLAILPDSVSFEQAATLPAAGLTAWYAMERIGPLLQSNLLIRGASGGVGHFAVQMAVRSGATVTGLVRQEKHLESVRDAGATYALADETGEAARPYGPYNAVLDLACGQGFRRVIDMLAPLGLAICGGVLAGGTTTLDCSQMVRRGWTVSGLYVLGAIQRDSASLGLERLVQMVECGNLKPLISLEAPWTDIGNVANQLRDRAYPGKAILHVAN